MTATEGYDDLSLDECWALLRRAPVARLAVDIAGRPEIFPINIVVDDDTIVFRSGAGTKLAGAVLNRWVAVEIDGEHADGRSVWSVIVKGEAYGIDKMQERYDAEELPLYPWVASPKPEFVRIIPTEVTGRRFRVAEHVGSLAGAIDGRAREPLEYHPGAPRLRPD